MKNFRYLFVAVAFLAFDSGYAKAEIGSVAAVNRDMEGTPPQANRRALILGNEVYQNERIETSLDGSGQLMFQDQTTLSVAPGSDIILDEYTYDPDRQFGEMQLSVGRGMLRLVGGRITKKNAAIIRTPTATIGIRGGMVLVEVLADGTTRVLLLAGEYAWISEGDDEDDPRIYLSRPNAEAEWRDGKLVFNGLLGPDGLARYYGALEGSGNGGSDLGEQAADEVQAPARNVASVNSGIEGGERRQPVSTSGEQPVDAESVDREDVRDEDDFQTAGGGVAPPVDPTDPNAGGGGGPVVPPAPPGFPLPDADNFSGPPLSINFDDVQFGSLIGTNSAEGFQIRIPTPETNEEFVDSFRIGTGDEETFVFSDNFFAGSQSPNAGYYQFTTDDGGFATPVGSDFGGGAIEGAAFADFDEAFVLARIETVPTDPATPRDKAFVTFGTPSPNRLLEFSGDDGTIPNTANTVDVFRIDDSLTPEIHTLRAFDNLDPLPDQLFMVVDGGETRWIPRQPGVPTQNGSGHVVGADADRVAGRRGQLDRVSRFTVTLDPIRPSSQNVPHVSMPIFSSVSDADGVHFIRHPVSAIDAFGSEDNYLVLRSSIFNGASFNFREPEIAAIDAETDALTTSFGDGTTRLIARDPTGAEIINDPFPLADQDPGRLENGQLGSFNIGAAAGIAICSDGTCGDDGSGAFTGAYNLRGAFGDSVEVDFEPSRRIDAVNGVSMFLNLRDNLESNIFLERPGFGVDRDEFQLGSTQNNQGVYLDDERFAVVDDGRVVSVAGNGRTARHSFIAASSQMAGTDAFNFQNLNGPLDDAPEFARWGWWSMHLTDIIDQETRQDREDIVHMGTWVAGVAPDVGSSRPVAPRSTKALRSAPTWI